MSSYSKALLAVTYKNGKAGTLTNEHQEAEHHRFKSYLFKEKIIPKNLYIARLIQQYLIIKAIETKLQNVSDTDKLEVNAFFTLSYLDSLWRTLAMKTDLLTLGVNPDKIPNTQITAATKRYIQDIETLPPKSLLAHFLLHIAGFMHGGHVIKTKYIAPSNQLADYYISTKQYDFSSTANQLPERLNPSLAVYSHLMKEMDTIILTPQEYQAILEQGKIVYETMTNIYDDLCKMFIDQPRITYIAPILGVSMIAIAFVFQQLMKDSNQVDDLRMTYNFM